MTPQQKYQNAAVKIIGAVNERNPYVKEQVGHVIYDFVQMICGSLKAPKVTGMLISLPIEQIKEYLQSFDNLTIRVNEALQMINQQEGGEAPATINPEEQ
jgi:hypothetical protein